MHSKRTFLLVSLFVIGMSGCAIGEADRERLHFSEIEQCKQYFAAELQSAYGSSVENTEVLMLLMKINANVKGELAGLLNKSASDYGNAFDKSDFVLPLSDKQNSFAYEATSNNIGTISHCRGLESYLSSYLFADQLRHLAQEQGISIVESDLGIDAEIMDEISRALLVSLVAKRSATKKDLLYIEENGTIDVNISAERNTLRFGGSLVPLIVCSEPESRLCLESEYFSLLIPGDDSRQWKHGGFAFDLLPTTTHSPCPSLSLIHVQSDQAGRFFDFYWNDEQGLVAWRVAYAAADEREEKLFVLERLRQQCNQAS